MYENNFQINVADIIDQSRSNGPGLRCVIWLQGCLKHCKGCYNPEMWDFSPKTLFTPKSLLQYVLTIPDIEGITLSGGEPLLQFNNLKPFLKELRKHDLSVVCFTGYDLSEIPQTELEDVRKLIDILIAGPFIEEQKCYDRPLIGSKNQKIYFFTDRYSYEDIQNIPRYEIFIEGGSIKFTGIVDPNEINIIKKKLSLF